VLEESLRSGDGINLVEEEGRLVSLDLGEDDGLGVT
jgi:hypothetical protein